MLFPDSPNDTMAGPTLPEAPVQIRKRRGISFLGRKRALVRRGGDERCQVSPGEGLHKQP